MTDGRRREGSGRSGGGEWFDVPLRVRYAETDAQGVVYHANYLVYMEVARTAFSRERGLPYQEVESRGVKLVVIRAELDYRSPARYDDQIVVRLRVADLRDKIVAFRYRIERPGSDGPGSDDLLVRAGTTHICTDSDLRPISIPPWLGGALGG